MKKILVADDDPAICDSIQFMLEEEGYLVATTVNGETVQHMDKEFPDLLLLDIWLSGQDGREICKQLKNQASTKHIPIILVSASRDLVKSAHEAGANDFVAKPFHMEELLGKISKWLAQS